MCRILLPCYLGCTFRGVPSFVHFELWICHDYGHQNNGSIRWSERKNNHHQRTRIKSLWSVECWIDIWKFSHIKNAKIKWIKFSRMQRAKHTQFDFNNNSFPQNILRYQQFLFLYIQLLCLPNASLCIHIYSQFLYSIESNFEMKNDAKNDIKCEIWNSHSEWREVNLNRKLVYPR